MASSTRDSKPTNAYELLMLVADHIEEEPRRYNQGEWAATNDIDLAHAMPVGAPACGTVCCRAGWIVGLHDGLPALPRLQALAFGAIWTRALQIIGMTDEETGSLFNAFVSSDDNDWWYGDDDEEAGDVCDAPLGSVEYAKFGAEGLRAFAERHREHLTARLLSDVPPLRQS